jgi:hypothetical protein
MIVTDFPLSPNSFALGIVLACKIIPVIKASLFCFLLLLRNMISLISEISDAKNI